MSRVIVLGAGSMGYLYASYLAKNPAIDLTLVSHDAKRADLLNRNGIRMTENGVDQITRIKTIPGGTHVPPADYLGIFVKAHQTETALRENSGLIDAHTRFFSLQNGLGACRNLPEDRLILGISNHNSTYIGPEHILHAASGETIIGSLSGDIELAERIANLFTGTGMKITTVPDIRPKIWEKLMVNLVINPLTMLACKENGIIVSDPEYRMQAEKLICEAVQVAAADGQNFDRTAILKHVFEVAQHTGKGKSSMLQDRLAGRRTEIDFINGAIVRLGKKYHIPTPCNEQILQRIADIEKTFLTDNK